MNMKLNLKDIKKLTDADVILYNGLNLETGNGWFEKALEQAGKSLKDKKVIAVSKDVKPIYLNGEEGNKDKTGSTRMVKFR